MYNFLNFLDVLFKDTNGIRICNHESCCLFVKSCTQSFNINHAFCVGFQFNNFIAGHCNRCWIGAMSSVRNNYFFTGISFRFVVSTNYFKSSPFTMCTGNRLERNFIHTGDLCKHVGCFIVNFQSTL